MNKRLIICGPTCSGKTYLRERMENRGLVFDISYTSREPRQNEVNGVHYHFVTKDFFEWGIKNDWFYEWVEYSGNYYGTGMKEWNSCSCFIMETDGIRHIKHEDRKNCFIVFLNPSERIRKKRMKRIRKSIVRQRLRADRKKFNGFEDYDVIITDPNF